MNIFTCLPARFCLFLSFVAMSLAAAGQAPAAPTVSGNLYVCSGSKTTLTASGVSGASFAWYDAATGGNLLSTSATYTTQVLTTGTSFYVQQTVSGNTSARYQAYVLVAPIPSFTTPQNILATPSTICQGQSSNLSASVDATANQYVYWYDSAVGGNLLGSSASGGNFTVSPMATKTYYAQSQAQVITQTFNVTGGVQAFTVPAGVTSIQIDARGGWGGYTYNCGPYIQGTPGKGGRVQATMSVTPGQVLYIYVGQHGMASIDCHGSAGYNGGGSVPTNDNYASNGGGGGATDIRVGGQGLANRVLVAGGGGGPGDNGYAGGAGGGLTGGNGANSEYNNYGLTQSYGTGGSQTAGGTGGLAFGCQAGGGSLGQGGSSFSSCNNTETFGGGGGGGGYYGGGAGLGAGGGGGGSSYTNPAMFQNVVHTQGYNGGDGQLVITYNAACAIRLSDTVKVNPLPVITINASTDTVVSGSTVTLTAGGAASYVWSNNIQNGVAFTPASSATYKVTGTDSNGCKGNDSINLTVLNLPVITTFSPAAAAQGSVVIIQGKYFTTATGVTIGGVAATAFTVNSDSSITATVGNATSGNISVTTLAGTVSVPGFTSIVSATTCFGSPANLSAAGTAPYTWYNALSGGTLLYTGQYYTTPNITTNTPYWYSANGGPRIQVNVGLYNSGPVNVTPSPVSIVQGASASLTASAFKGGIHWYTTSTGGTAVGTSASGAAFSVSPVDTTTYYAEADSSSGPLRTESLTFPYTGAVQTFTVPAGVTSIQVDATAGQGGDSRQGGGGKAGGKGGRVQTTLTVTPGQVLYISAGGAGQGGTGCSNCYTLVPGGWNGGGNGYYPIALSGSGGGATDIRVGGQALANRVIVAGGGGGAGDGMIRYNNSCDGGQGGTGGGLIGGNGNVITCQADAVQNGKGGTQSAGGAAGCTYGLCGNAGSLGIGGDASGVSGNYGGGGGGGYYGGGAGNDRGGAGGGSSYTDPTLCSNVIHTQGYSSGNGSVTLTYLASCAPVRVPVTVNVIHPPVITSFSPVSAGSGTTVTIKGVKFTGATAVSFGNVSAVSYIVAADSIINAVVSGGATGSVSVTTPGGTATKAGFTFIAGPTITSYTPVTATTGKVVTITGSNFTGATAVSFGGTNATSFTVISATSIQAVVGAGATGSVSVTTPGGTGSLAGFTYCTPVAPTVTIAANIASPICTGTKVTFTATPVNGGTAPAYQWYKNNAVVGTASTYTDSLLKNSDSVWCVLTSNSPCATTTTATSSKLKYTVNALIAPTVTIAANIASPICTGTKVTFTATPVNGGAAPTYQWYKNNVVVGTASTYTDSLLKNSDSVWCVLTSNAACTVTKTATSSKLKYTVNALAAPSLTITANIASPICTGTKVTFTATPVNGGTSPTYQWYKNNAVVGTASTYTDSLLKNSDSVWSVLTSNSACITTTSATSSKLKYTVNALSAPTVSIAANIASPICTGTKVTFTATPVNGGTAPAYQWYKNNAVVGTASTYTDSLLKNSDSVWCVLTSNAACITTTTATSSKLKYTVNALSAPTVSIAANIASPICTGTKVTFTATPVNGGTAPTYQWYKNNAVVGTASTYTDSLLKNSDSVWCVLTSNAACITTTSATSSKLKYTVNALSAPTVSIAANIASPICTGTKVTFTATPVNGGTAPTYQWYKNNIVVGTASTYTDSLLKNSDSVWCVLTSNAACTVTKTATSSKLKYTVNALSAPSVSIAANIASPICTGTKVTFTATPVNGGTAPVYQWYKNNVAVGTASTYTDSLLKNSDSVWCVLTSNSACITTNTATSNKLKYTVNALSAPTVSIAANIASPICTGTKVTFTATPVNGGTSPTYQWYKNNAVVGTASTYTDSLLKNSDSVWCVLTSNAACIATTSATSSKLKYAVNALIAPSVTIAANIASPICTGTKVTFTATPVNGGAAPTYQWYKNNVVVGTTSTYTDSLLKNSDSVWCVLTSNATCITTTSATSSKLKYTVNAGTAPTVSISANPGNTLCYGTKDVFTAIALNAGTTPAYQWYRSNIKVGTSASTYTDSTLKGGDSVWVVVSANTGCGAGSATSNKIGIVQAGAAQNFAYIPNGYSKTVSVVNINTGKLVATVPLGTGVGGVSVTPDSKKVYFTNSQDNTVSVLSTATNTITKTISGFGSPQGVVVSPDGSKAYVVNASGFLFPEIMAINVNADTIMPSAAINGGLSGLWVSITPDGKKLYVANQSNSISVLSTTNNSLVKTISMNFPWGITVSPDSKKAYVSNYNNNTVSVINAVADTLMTVIPVGTNPLGLAASPDGSKVYVTNTGSSSIGIINTTTNAVTGTIAVDSGPYGISITPDGGTLVTANDYSNTANIVSTATNSSTSSVGIGGSPLGLGNFIASLPSACPVLTPAVSITANTPATLCANTKVTFTAAPVNGGSVPAYQWYKNSKTVGTNSVSYQDSLLKTGDSVWCVLTSNAAPLAITTAKSNILVFTVSTVVTPSVIIVPSVASPICAGAKVSFTATVVNGGTAPAYQWYKNNTVVGTASTYTDSLLKNSDSVWCVVTGNANCTAGNTAKSNRLYYTVNALPVKPTLTQKGVTSFCLYDSLILTATVTPGTLQWYRNNGAIKLANTSRYAVKVAGSYKLLLTGSNGCAIMSDSVIATVTQVARPTITLVNDTLVSSAAAGNQWYENSVILPGATGKSFAPINIDAYTVQATSAGCVSPMSDPYIYTAGTFGFKGKTPGAGKANALLYPNPAGSTANLRLSGFTSGVIVTVTDMTGKVVWQQDKLVNSTYTLPLSNLAQGNYIVTVKDKTAIISLRLIKAR